MPDAPVPLVDLRRQYAPLLPALQAAACQTLADCDFIGGKAVRVFEAEFATALGVAASVGVANATAGLHAALHALGIGPGDEVIVPAHTAIATAEAVTLAGAQVVFADIEPDTCTLDPDDVARRITPRTRAIVPVHLYGHAADLDRLLPLARAHALWVVEDCAQAVGAQLHGQALGSFGDAGVYSFFPSKNLGGFGDGGAVIARDPALLKKIRMYSNHGREDKFRHDFEGTNSRLDTLQAALLRVNLPHLATWNAARRAIADQYRQRLGHLDWLQLPVQRDGAEHIYHVYVVRTQQREALAAHLHELGIRTGLHYPIALHRQPAYARLNLGPGSLPVAEEACASCLSLPMFPGLTPAEVERVCDAVEAFHA
ncbi:DegT/DnrJ/EryC1/StrS family aminotransferase [Immundisolibacter sp.]|uniref:DegT/DnrJ/EryC1/StrS family aminotransferase n=1 Tax=Immundisolibacter sp. TaxID=1934948 RepID=UPI002B0C7927|nr:DegT/DnrJ/EryC1/StrS family aminotransferase [Immundisolibacter sp.]MEA3220931.1 dTDP-3-amino-3,4,6-trideoxy-alpha-D-glucose transaminase [Immundisolibacter sp.]